MKLSKFQKKMLESEFLAEDDVTYDRNLLRLGAAVGTLMAAEANDRPLKDVDEAVIEQLVVESLKSLAFIANAWGLELSVAAKLAVKDFDV